MSQFNCANSPYEIFTQPSPFDVSQWGELPDGAQPYDPQWHQPAQEQCSSQQSDEEDESSEPPPPVQNAPKLPKLPSAFLVQFGGITNVAITF